MSKKKAIFAAIVILAAGATVACGYHHHKHDAHHVKKVVSYRIDSVLDDVDATSAQEEKIHRIRDKLFADLEAAHAGSKEARGVALGEWNSATPNREKLHQLADARIAAYQKAIHQTIDGMLEVHATLDPKQRAEISERVTKHMTR